MKKIVVLNSGGFDSIVLLNYLKTIQGEADLHSLHFLYGATNEEQQLNCVNKVCSKLGVDNKIIQIPTMDWTKSSFFSCDEVLVENRYLEYRNLIFLSYALSYAQSIGAEVICLALINNSEYVDCNVEFIQGVNSISQMSGITVDAPFIFDSKQRLAHIAKYLDIKDDEYFSCDTPKNGLPCGVCPDCVALKEIWKKVL